ncbi:MatE domain containing protein [Pyrenophora tritici-repentis]|nr:MatE domain containing protein [Pyrenophora tritici-repentis]
MAPLTTEEEVEIVAPLWDVQPAVVSTKKQQRQQNAPPADIYANEDKHFDTEEYEYDISSLALSFVPLPFTSGGGGSGCYTAAYYRTMDAPEARRFSTSTAERVGLLKSSAAKNHSQYGAVMADPAEIESLLGGGGEGDEEELGTTTAGQEARLLLKYSVPLMGTYLLQYSFSLVTIFVVGHIGTDELGAVSLATMTANITGLAIYEGLATSLDTLCAQAYGSGKKTMVGLHLQRMVLFMLAVTIPIGAVWLCSGWILAALVPEKELAHLAGYYLSLLLAGAPGYAIFEAGKRFTQAQGLFNASLFVLLIATPVNIALNYVFVFVLNWDLTGAALATVISNNLLPLLLWIYVYFVNPASLECWGGFTKAAFTNWGPMARLTVPGIVMVETEWLAFDILTFSTSYLSTTHLAAQSMYVPPPIPPQPN